MTEAVVFTALVGVCILAVCGVGWLFYAVSRLKFLPGTLRSVARFLALALLMAPCSFVVASMAWGMALLGLPHWLFFGIVWPIAFIALMIYMLQAEAWRWRQS